jgi:hypothetical protein
MDDSRVTFRVRDDVGSDNIFNIIIVRVVRVASLRLRRVDVDAVVFVTE